MDKKLLLLLILFVSKKSISQEDKKILYGKISDELGVLSEVHIINIATNVATYSNNIGEFRISVKIGDSLKITSVGYKTLIIKTSVKHFGITENRFKMIPDIIELDEVEVEKNNLTGSIYSDVKQIKNRKLINASTLQLPNANKRKMTTAERRLYTAKSGALGFIINTLNGKIKTLKEEKRNEDEEKEIKYLKTHFKNYLIHDLKIDPLQIGLFISYFKEDLDYKKNKHNEFFLIKFIKRKSIEFKNENH